MWYPSLLVGVKCAFGSGNEMFLGLYGVVAPAAGQCFKQVVSGMRMFFWPCRGGRSWRRPPGRAEGCGFSTRLWAHRLAQVGPAWQRVRSAWKWQVRRSETSIDALRTGLTGWLCGVFSMSFVLLTLMHDVCFSGDWNFKRLKNEFQRMMRAS